VSKLEVNNQVFRYKNKKYQIGNIVSIDHEKEDRKNSKKPPSRKKERFWFIASLLLFAFSACVYAELLSVRWEAAVVIAVLASYLLFVAGRSWLKRVWFPKKETMYIFYMALSNGDTAKFESTNRARIYKVFQGVEDAMNGKDGVNVVMKDSQISLVNSSMSVN